MEHIWLKRIRSKEDIERVRVFFPDIFPEEKERLEDCIGAFEESIDTKTLDDGNVLDYYFICKDNGLIIGMTGMYSNDPYEVWLGWFGIAPTYRKQGYGAKALLMTMNVMMSMGYFTARLYTNPNENADAERLYRNMGFVQDSKYDSKTITMAKTLLIPFGADKYRFKTWEGKPYGM